MNKKYIVRLLDTEREVLRDVIKQLKGSSQKVRRAQILLKADVDGPGWTDEKSADAFSCRVQTVESIRQSRQQLGLVASGRHTAGFADRARGAFYLGNGQTSCANL